MHFKCTQCGHEFCSGCYQTVEERRGIPTTVHSGISYKKGHNNIVLVH